MARGKFNKRREVGSAAVSAEEIEIRNARLAEMEEERAQRRAEEDEDEEGGEEGDGEETEQAGSSKPKDKAGKPGEAPAVVTTAEDHKRNMAKLAEVKKRREAAEAKRKAEEEAAVQAEEERKKQAAAVTGDDGKKKKKDKEVKIPKLDKIAVRLDNIHIIIFSRACQVYCKISHQLLPLFFFLFLD